METITLEQDAVNQLNIFLLAFQKEHQYRISSINVNLKKTYEDMEGNELHFPLSKIETVQIRIG